MPKGKYTSTISVSKLRGLKYSSILGIKEKYKRSTINTKEDKNSITFLISADDAVALRASMNAIMRNIEIIEKAYKAKL